MDYLKYYQPPKDRPTESQNAPRATSAGCFLITGIGGIAGLTLGASNGIRQYYTSVEDTIRTGGTVDYMPVGVPILALAGAIMGALAGAITMKILACVMKILTWIRWRI